MTGTPAAADRRRTARVLLRLLLVLVVGLAAALGGACADDLGTDRGADPAASRASLQDRRSVVRSLLADLARPAVAQGGRSELRGAWEGCRSDRLGLGYRSWTYAGGGRLLGGVGLGDVERVLTRTGATALRRSGRSLEAVRDGVAVTVTRSGVHLVVTARAAACVEVPADQQQAWLDRERRPRVPVGGGW